jgi:hypothetical protein
LKIGPPHQLRQLGDIGGNAPRFVIEQLCRPIKTHGLM